MFGQSTLLLVKTHGLRPVVPHFLTQKSFTERLWLGLATLWWLVNLLEEPDDDPDSTTMDTEASRDRKRKNEEKEKEKQKNAKEEEQANRKRKEEEAKLATVAATTSPRGLEGLQGTVAHGPRVGLPKSGGKANGKRVEALRAAGGMDLAGP